MRCLTTCLFVSSGVLHLASCVYIPLLVTILQYLLIHMVPSIGLNLKQKLNSFRSSPRSLYYCTFLSKRLRLLYLGCGLSAPSFSFLYDCRLQKCCRDVMHSHGPCAILMRQSRANPIPRFSIHEAQENRPKSVRDAL